MGFRNFWVARGYLESPKMSLKASEGFRYGSPSWHSLGAGGEVWRTSGFSWSVMEIEKYK